MPSNITELANKSDELPTILEQNAGFAAFFIVALRITA
jgi:hypothetical protein